jgi:hypothetical protein
LGQAALWRQRLGDAWGSIGRRTIIAALATAAVGAVITYLALEFLGSDTGARDAFVTAIVFVGLTAILIVFSVLLSLVTAPHRDLRSRVEVLERRAGGGQSRGTVPASWVSHAELGEYLAGISKTMEDHGFGSGSSAKPSRRPVVAPLEYQMDMLVKVIEEFSRHSIDGVWYSQLDQALESTERAGADERYEPLLAKNVHLGLNGLLKKGRIKKQETMTDTYYAWDLG